MPNFAIFILSLLLVAGANPATTNASNSSSSSSPAAIIGINYGQVADNLPSPATVLPLLRSLGVSRVKLYDTDASVLAAFANTGVEFVVGLPDRLLPKIAASPSAALAWLKSNLSPHLPSTKISALTVGNEVLSSNDTARMSALVPAMQSLHDALASLGLDRQIAVTTAHSLAVLAASYPPSAASFRRDLLPYVCPLLAFLAKTGSPFLINAYPYFAYKADPKRVVLDYVLFEPNAGVVDPGSGLRYDNMLHAQVDAVRAAIAAAGSKGVEIRVSETGWPSSGDEDEAGATPENARRYNGNLMKMVGEGKGTPAAPWAPLKVYIFALFNENLKPGPASERHYGLYKPDGTQAYDFGVGRNGTFGGDGDGGDRTAAGPAQMSDDSAVSYFEFSAASELWNWRRRLVMVIIEIGGLVVLWLSC